MKLANNPPALGTGFIQVEASLEALFHRLEDQAMEPGFRAQRELALNRALRPYVASGRLLIAPMPEEVALAKLYLYADFYPEDGQLSLVEQVRDLIEVHVPLEERAWLDPLHHSYMDLLEVCGVERGGRTVLRSAGDQQEFHTEPILSAQPGRMLLTRLIRLPDRAVVAGVAVILSAAAGRNILERALEQRREMEALAGSFVLADWPEFCKRFGHALLWNLAQARLEAIARADAAIRYRRPGGEPFLYALALYEHGDFHRLVEGLGGIADLHIVNGSQRESQACIWVEREDSDGPLSQRVVARLALSRTQLVVECDSAARLDRFKHLLAATFGYALHFRVDAATPPDHELPEVDLSREPLPPAVVVVSPEEERRLLGAFLESAYLEWADLPSPALQGRTPRHAATDPQGKTDVASLISELEHSDPCRQRTGQAGYDYNRLRAHVGL